MVPFARELARAGLVVLTPEMTDLADYRITRQGVSVIRDAARLSRRRGAIWSATRGWAARLQLRGRAVAGRRREPELAGPRRLRRQRRRPPRSRARAALPDPQRGRDADGRRAQQAHDYGLVVLLYGARRPVRARARSRGDARRPARLAARGSPGGARGGRASRRPSAGRRLWQLVDSQQAADAGARAGGDRREQSDELAALSPRGRLAAIRAPVYLVHGADDSVIPAERDGLGGRRAGRAPITSRSCRRCWSTSR